MMRAAAVIGLGLVLVAGATHAEELGARAAREYWSLPTPFRAAYGNQYLTCQSNAIVPGVIANNPAVSMAEYERCVAPLRRLLFAKTHPNYNAFNVTDSRADAEWQHNMDTANLRSQLEQQQNEIDRLRIENRYR